MQRNGLGPTNVNINRGQTRAAISPIAIRDGRKDSVLSRHSGMSGGYHGVRASTSWAAGLMSVIRVTLDPA
jgi:hypothetical protein